MQLLNWKTFQYNIIITLFNDNFKITLWFIDFGVFVYSGKNTKLIKLIYFEYIQLSIYARIVVF